MAKKTQVSRRSDTSLLSVTEACNQGVQVIAGTEAMKRLGLLSRDTRATLSASGLPIYELRTTSGDRVVTVYTDEAALQAKLAEQARARTDTARPQPALPTADAEAQTQTHTHTALLQEIVARLSDIDAVLLAIHDLWKGAPAPKDPS